MQGKNASIRSPSCHPNRVEHTWLSFVCILNGLEQIILVVSLAKVVLDVIIFGWYSQLDKLSFECAGLLKEAMYLTVNLHT